MNNKVNFLRGTSAEYEASTKDNDTFYYTTDTEKLYLGETEITGIEVDDTSTTATDKTWSAKKISDSIPTTLPANGGNADTLDGLHANEIASNPNLLDNPDFKINQRGESVYSQSSKSPKMSVDRWAIFKHSSTETGDITLTPISSGGVVLNNQTDGKAAMYQRIENFSDLFGKQITFSASINGSILSLTATCTNATAQSGDLVYTDDKSAYLRICVVLDTYVQFEIYLNAGASITVDWAKVEIGGVATPFCPPDPATELAKCQRYYQRLSGLKTTYGVGFIGGIYATINIALANPMRIAPTITINGEVCAATANHNGEDGVIRTSTWISGWHSSPCSATVVLDISSVNDARIVGNACLLQIRDADSYIELSAEL